MLVEFLKEYACHRPGAVVAMPGGVAAELVRRGIARPVRRGIARPAPEAGPRPKPKRGRA